MDATEKAPLMTEEAPDILRSNLARLMREQGYNPTSLSVEAGLSRNTVGKIMSVPGADAPASKNPRSDTLAKLARVLGVSVAELIGEAPLADGAGSRRIPAVAKDTFSRLHVRWTAEAGAWREVDTQSIDVEYRDVVIRGSADHKFLSEIKGDSMLSLGFTDGCYAVCLEWAEVGRDPINDDILLVQQTRDGGITVETTLKQVVVYPDRYELQPRSPNPVHKTITIPRKRHADDDGREVVILGKAIGIYRDLM